MQSFGKYADNIFTVTIRPDRSFYVIDNTRCLNNDPELLLIIEKEIDSWKLRNIPGSFSFSYALVNQNTDFRPHIQHGHLFIQTEYSIGIEKVSDDTAHIKLYRLYNNNLKCAFCSLCYITEIKQLL